MIFSRRRMQVCLWFQEIDSSAIVIWFLVETTSVSVITNRISDDLTAVVVIFVLQRSILSDQADGRRDRRIGIVFYRDLVSGQGHRGVPLAVSYYVGVTVQEQVGRKLELIPDPQFSLDGDLFAIHALILEPEIFPEQFYRAVFGEVRLQRAPGGFRNSHNPSTRHSSPF